MKYKLTEETRELEQGVIVYRIEALKDFKTIAGDVKKGDKGGWIASEENLSQLGSCWLFDESVGYENSRRSGDSIA